MVANARNVSGSVMLRWEIAAAMSRRLVEPESP